MTMIPVQRFCVVRLNRSAHAMVAGLDLAVALEAARPGPGDMVEVQLVQAIDAGDALVVASDDGWVTWLRGAEAIS